MSEKVAEVARLGAAGGLGQARGRGVVPAIGEAGGEESEGGGRRGVSILLRHRRRHRPVFLIWFYFEMKNARCRRRWMARE